MLPFSLSSTLLPFQTQEARVAVLNCHCEDDDYHPDVTPIVLAAQRNDFIIVKVCFIIVSTRPLSILALTFDTIRHICYSTRAIPEHKR